MEEIERDFTSSELEEEKRSEINIDDTDPYNAIERENCNA